MFGCRMTRERRLALSGGALLAVAFLYAHPAGAGGGDPYDNDSPWGAPENGNGTEEGPQHASGTASHIVVQLQAGASAEAADVETSAARLRISGADIRSLDSKSGVGAIGSELDQSSVVIELDAGQNVILDENSGDVLVQGGFEVESNSSALALLPGGKFGPKTAFVLIGKVDGNGRMTRVSRVISLPLSGANGIDLTKVHADATAVPWLDGLDVLVILTSTIIDLQTGNASISIDGSAQFEVGAFAEGVEVNTNGL